MKEDNISQLGDYDVPFCEQQYTHGSCYISLFKFTSFDQYLIPPKLPHILDIYSVVALWYINLLAKKRAVFISQPCSGFGLCSSNPKQAWSFSAFARLNEWPSTQQRKRFLDELFVTLIRRYSYDF